MDAQLHFATAACYLAEVDQELRDKSAAQQAAVRGIKAAEKAVALKPASGEAYRLLGMFYGQAITDLMSGLSYGPRAKDAISKAVMLAPKSAAVVSGPGRGKLLLAGAVGRRRGGRAGGFP